MTDMSAASAERIRSKHLVLHPGARGRSDLRGDFSKRLAAVSALVLLVLLVACANLANLLAAKTAGRQRELAVKTALGAPRGRLARDLLLQSALLALAGGALGLLLAESLLGAAIRVLPFDRVADASTRPDRPARARFRVRRLGALGPPLRARAGARALRLRPLAEAPRGVGRRRGQPAVGALAPRARRRTGGALGRRPRRGRAVHAEPAAAPARSTPDSRSDNVVTFAVAPELSGYSPERSLEFFERLEERLRALPGVEGAAMLDNGCSPTPTPPRPCASTATRPPRART